MTHDKNNNFLSFSYLLFSSQSFCMEINPCNQKLTTETEAKACLNWRLKNQGNGLYKKALTDGHRGNIKIVQNQQVKIISQIQKMSF
jgi:hypothetical protein